ncbi:MAG: aldo/keto reductase [Synergistaceae bacterium]|jgi:aryl-alcohol dehydrogenase-like predicted oxidoreductase|nr:aldo/keto reductase [Synergistaceae bacterium]
MKKMMLGKTGLLVSWSGFGALPIQRVGMAEAVPLLRAALDGGIDFYDTARSYTDSESKVGAAFGQIRDRVVIATKSHSLNGESLMKDLHTSLKELRTDHVDVYQFHIAKKIHAPGDPDGLYDAASRAKADGKIGHIGLTTHLLSVALEAAVCGLYETLQFPLSYLSSEKDLDVVRLCRENGVGFIAMKALSGGLITDARAAFFWMRQQEGVVPIWGIQSMGELEEFLALEENPPDGGEAASQIERDRRDLSGSFCRGCGYCLPCPAGIEINWVARMPQALRRMKAMDFVTPEWREKMERSLECIRCGDCARRCPYELDAPSLIEASYADYKLFTAEWDKNT